MSTLLKKRTHSSASHDTDESNNDKEESSEGGNAVALLNDNRSDSGSPDTESGSDGDGVGCVEDVQDAPSAPKRQHLQGGVSGVGATGFPSEVAGERRISGSEQDATTSGLSSSTSETSTLMAGSTSESGSSRECGGTSSSGGSNFGNSSGGSGNSSSGSGGEAEAQSGVLSEDSSSSCASFTKKAKKAKKKVTHSREVAGTGSHQHRGSKHSYSALSKSLEMSTSDASKEHLKYVLDFMLTLRSTTKHHRKTMTEEEKLAAHRKKREILERKRVVNRRSARRKRARERDLMEKLSQQAQELGTINQALRADTGEILKLLTTVREIVKIRQAQQQATPSSGGAASASSSAANILGSSAGGNSGISLDLVRKLIASGNVNSAEAEQLQRLLGMGNSPVPPQQQQQPVVVASVSQILPQTAHHSSSSVASNSSRGESTHETVLRLQKELAEVEASRQALLNEAPTTSPTNLPSIPKNPPVGAQGNAAVIAQQHRPQHHHHMPAPVPTQPSRCNGNSNKNGSSGNGNCVFPVPNVHPQQQVLTSLPTGMTSPPTGGGQSQPSAQSQQSLVQMPASQLSSLLPLINQNGGLQQLMNLQQQQQQYNATGNISSNSSQTSEFRAAASSHPQPVFPISALFQQSQFGQQTNSGMAAPPVSPAITGAVTASSNNNVPAHQALMSLLFSNNSGPMNSSMSQQQQQVPAGSQSVSAVSTNDGATAGNSQDPTLSQAVYALIGEEVVSLLSSAGGPQMQIPSAPAAAAAIASHLAQSDPMQQQQQQLLNELLSRVCTRIMGHQGSPQQEASRGTSSTGPDIVN